MVTWILSVSPAARYRLVAFRVPRLYSVFAAISAPLVVLAEDNRAVDAFLYASNCQLFDPSDEVVAVSDTMLSFVSTDFTVTDPMS